jgi:RNA polymerase sigma factor (sigma-70 family)
VVHGLTFLLTGAECFRLFVGRQVIDLAVVFDRMNVQNDSWTARLTAAGPVQNEALAELRSVLFARLRKTFLGRTGVDEPLLEDVTQEALLKSLDSLDQFQGKSLFTTWATTIAVRIAFTELRRRHWKDVSLEHLLANSAPVSRQITDTDSRPHLEADHNGLVDEMYRIIETELTEHSLKGKSVPEGLQAIEHHLAICGECQDEYRALLTALQTTE